MGGGRGVQDGAYMYTHGGFKSIYGKNQYNIVKLKKKIPHVAGQLSPCATIREPVHSGACVLQLENPHNATTEPVHHHKRSCMMQQTCHMPQLRPDTAK